MFVSLRVSHVCHTGTPMWQQNIPYLWALRGVVPQVPHYFHSLLYILFIYLFTIEVKRSGTSGTVVFKRAWLSLFLLPLLFLDVAQDVAQFIRCGTHYILVNVLCGFLKSLCLILLTS